MLGAVAGILVALVIALILALGGDLDPRPNPGEA
jgi:hypothetical protein